MSYYSSSAECRRILELLIGSIDTLPQEVAARKHNVKFTATRDRPYFPIPFKETEVTAALKALEGSIAAALASVNDINPTARTICVNLEKTTAFLFQAYLARVGGLGKLDQNVKSLLKGTNISSCDALGGI